jgi:hypothetical protein
MSMRLAQNTVGMTWVNSGNEAADFKAVYRQSTLSGSVLEWHVCNYLCLWRIKILREQL